MSNIQQLVDHLYNSIFIQKIRCDHFTKCGVQPINSIWNKHSDEQAILHALIERYVDFYRKKAVNLKNILDKEKVDILKSYLTYDTEYYINKYIKYHEDIEKYLVLLDNKTFEDISTCQISSISTDIDSKFPYYIINPTLLGTF